MAKGKEVVDSAPAASRKRRTADDSEQVRAAEFKEEAEWPFLKKDWKKKGKLHYEKLKQQRKKGRKFSAFDQYLFDVHFPRIAPASYEIAVVDGSPGKAKRGKGQTEAVFWGCSFTGNSEKTYISTLQTERYQKAQQRKGL
jgi:hypothetical protein